MLFGTYWGCQRPNGRIEKKSKYKKIILRITWT
jgi:hypothetical protein